MANSPGWKAIGPIETQRFAPLIVCAETGQRRQDQEPDCDQAERVLVVVEAPVVFSDDEHGECEDRDADHDPDALAPREFRIDPVDEGQPSRGQEPDEREERLVGLRQPDAQDDVRGDEEGQEERGVGERGGREALGVLTDDEDACEACCGKSSDDQQVQELAITNSQGVASSS